MPNIPHLFDNECWDSLTKVELQANNITDQLAGMGINDQPAKYPGKLYCIINLQATTNMNNTVRIQTVRKYR